MADELDNPNEDNRPSFRQRLAEAFAPDDTVVEKRERLDLLEASDYERRAVQRELDLLAYTALDYTGGRSQELRAVERRRLAQRARIAWMRDPQAGAAVDLMNDFVFGRGMPRPKANDTGVQKILDEAWDDPDNQLALTSYEAQLAIGTDLTLQSNLFFLVFDDGEDGRVKLGLLDHDSVERVVRDPENRRRILYYVVKQPGVIKEDFERGESTISPRPENERVIYYEHWRNVEDARKEVEEGGRKSFSKPSKARLGDGRVYHVAINRTGEMAFGHPIMDRLLRWYTAYNKFMDARVDIMEASASFVMKRKVKGTPNQLTKMATQALSRRSPLGSAIDDPDTMMGPRPASILTESENVTHEDFNINTNAPAAAQDAQMLRSQISAATRFPQSYYGDASNSSLATATSLELPVLKAVENRQEIIESMVRFFIDRIIERAVDSGKISSDLTPEERAALAKANGQPAPAEKGSTDLSMMEAHENAQQDEEKTARDLGYQFSLPSPLRRTMGDLVTSVMNIARTFDPNNTNMELSRTLLNVALGEGLELEDPAGAVDKVFPPGYVDPAVAAAEAGAAGGAEMPPLPNEQQNPDGSISFGEFSPTPGADGKQRTEDNPYGAKMKSTPPEAMSPSEANYREAEQENPDRKKKRVKDKQNELAAELEIELESLIPSAETKPDKE